MGSKSLQLVHLAVSQLTLQTLIDHLQSRPILTSQPPLEARHGYLPSTLRKVKAARMNAGSAAPKSLDPDFTLRDPHGQALAGEDQTYQNPLLETLWDLVRHGELDQAIKVCEQGGEPWRGASLMGGRRWSLGGMSECMHTISSPTTANTLQPMKSPQEAL
jgi:nuclear pore complex protein Nup107